MQFFKTNCFVIKYNKYEFISEFIQYLTLNLIINNYKNSPT